MFYKAYEIYFVNDIDSIHESKEFSDSYSHSEKEEIETNIKNKNEINEYGNNNIIIDSNLNNNILDNKKDEKNSNENNYSFSLGINLPKINEHKNIINSKLNYGFIEDKLLQVVDDYLFFKGFEYYKIKQYYIKKMLNIISIYILDVEIIGKMKVIGLIQKDFVKLKSNIIWIQI